MLTPALNTRQTDQRRNKTAVHAAIDRRIDQHPPAHRVIIEAALGCEDAGYSINIIVNPLSDNELLAIFRGGQADGMILMEIQTHDRRVEVLRQHARPFVLIGRCADNTGVSFVDIDIEYGVTTAMQYLIELGTARSAS